MMANPRSVPVIREAITLFEEYEAVQHLDSAAAQQFLEGLQVLNDYLEIERDSPHREYIARLKVSHTRSLLRNLAKLDRKDGLAWAGHAAILMLVNNEATALLQLYPDLKKDYDDFFLVWGPEVLAAIEQMEKDLKS